MNVLSGIAALLCVLLIGKPRTALPATSAVASSTPDRPGWIARWRGLLAALTAVAAWVVMGGAFGVLAGAIAGGLAWRALGNLESPRVQRRRAELESHLPTAIDLLVAVLEAGAAPAQALSVVGAALGGPIEEEFAIPARRLHLGGDPGQVWASLAKHPQLGRLGRALGRAYETGGSVVAAATRLADDLRDTDAARAEGRARSVSTKAAAPLGLCLLPAFILLGVVPLVAGLLSGLGIGL